MTDRPKFFDMPLGSSGAGWHHIEPMSRCPKEFQYARIRGVRKHRDSMVSYLAIGILLHAARAQWFYDDRQGDLWRKAMKRYRRRLLEAGEPEILEEHYQRAFKIFEAYVKYWALRPVTRIHAVEYMITPRWVMDTKADRTTNRAAVPEYLKRTARADSIESYDGEDGVWIGEAKSVYAGGRSRLGETYSLHGQPLLLAALWGPKEEKKFGKLNGILLDPMVKGDTRRRPTGAPRIKLHMKDLEVALRWFRRDMVIYLENANLVDWNTQVPRNAGTCMRPTGPCDFRDLCKLGRAGVIGYETSDGTPLIKWQPAPGQKVPPWE